VELYHDDRLYGLQTVVCGDPRDAEMRIPDELLKSVVFICKQGNSKASKYEFLATAFLFSVTIPEHPLPQCVYLVTAKHVIERSQFRGYDLEARVNKRGGDAEFVPLRGAWEVSDDPGCDLAVSPFPFENDAELFDCKSIDAKIVLDESARAAFKIGIGDSIFTIGLFSEHKGKRSNIPIIRTGSIAAVPSEPLEDDNSRAEYHAYLVDMISTPGLSGAPVFAFLEPDFPRDAISVPDQHGTALGTRYGRITGRGGRIYLLGVIRGHWKIDSVNMGIAIVTPIEDLMTLIKSSPRGRQ
jgi:hypothetical protein